MKTLLILPTLLLATSFAQADFLPRTVPQSAPVLQCHNAMAEIPESRLVVQVYQATEEQPFGFVTMKKVNTNAPDTPIFSGEVTEKTDTEATMLFAGGMNMKITGNNATGDVDAVISVQNGQELKYFNVNCNTNYQVMPISQAQSI